MDRLGVVAMSLAQCDAHCSFEAQTKILEGGTKDEIRISKEALFHDSWPKLSTHVESTRKAAFHLLFLLPKSSFGKDKMLNNNPPNGRFQFTIRMRTFLL